MIKNGYEWDNIHYIVNFENFVNQEIAVKPNQERLCIVRDAVNKMSAEAKFIFMMLFNTPNDVIDLLETKERKRISLLGLTNFLRGIGWKEKQVKKGLKDLKVMKNLL